MKTDVLALLDQMEEAIATAPSLPVGGRIVASRDLLLDLVDAIRREMPDAVVEADRITRDKARVLSEASDEAERIVDRARDQAEYIVHEHSVLKTAELEAERVLNRAREDAAAITASAEHYARDLFTRLEEEALRLAADIRKAGGQRP
ncbi:MAG: ATPase [Chloroflexi bacterium]|nr:ATPase [Chloroflexota bacterium]